MKLTGDLKKKVEEAASREANKAAIEQAGMELTDDELDNVAGGGCSTQIFVDYNDVKTLPFRWEIRMGCPTCSSSTCRVPLRREIFYYEDDVPNSGITFFLDGYICEKNANHKWKEAPLGKRSGFGF